MFKQTFQNVFQIISNNNVFEVKTIDDIEKEFGISFEQNNDIDNGLEDESL